MSSGKPERNLTAKVIGAGSIGNHHAHGLRGLGFDVTIVDTDSKALERTRTLIYPERYGSFDEGIVLAHPAQVEGLGFDLCVIGTPPESHLALATSEMENRHRLLLVEKPLAPPGGRDLERFTSHIHSLGTRVLVGYNQRLKQNTEKLLELPQSNDLGKLVALSARSSEDWAGILQAHPWISKAEDTYLGYSERGGGALYEHSHATDFALYIANSLGQGRPERVRASLDIIEHDLGSYDREASLEIAMSSGLSLHVTQDLHTWPAEKSLEAVFERGMLTWEMREEEDTVLCKLEGKPEEIFTFPKSRPDDFLPEHSHLLNILNSEDLVSSPLDLSETLYSAWSLEAAVASHDKGDWVPVADSLTQHA